MEPKQKTLSKPFKESKVQIRWQKSRSIAYRPDTVGMTVKRAMAMGGAKSVSLATSNLSFAFSIAEQQSH